MISPQELRIGNNFSHTNENGTFNLQVEEIRSTGVITLWNGGSWFVSFDKLDPIPLTEYILLKCGFGGVGFYENVYQKNNCRLHLGIKNSKDIFVYHQENNHLELEIIGLHQLQNIYFSLVGKELEVKL